VKSSHLLLERAGAAVRRICTQVPAAKTLLAAALLGGDAALAGAARAWHHRYHGE
jgi:hypothetical protein